jgi:ferritin-like metal-binding protein YciE
MALESLQELYIDELKDLYNAETQLVEVLPEFAKAATAPELKAAFEDHLVKTRGHLVRLDRVFEDLDTSAKGKKCKAMQGLIQEGKEYINDDGDDVVKDAALITAAQRVEHYEIAGYGCARSFARVLGFVDAAELLQETLDEEAETDKILTALADGGVNAKAAARGNDET